MARPAVFLDRDGVINAYVLDSEFGTIDSPANPAQFSLLPDVPEAIAKLNKTGLTVVVVTNQAGIAKGRFTPAMLDAITDKMRKLIAQAGGKLDAVYCCPHHPGGTIEEFRQHCRCRKPNVGLFEKAATDLNIDLGSSYTIGDGIVDILAGQRAGTKTVFISPRKCYVCSQLSQQDAWPDWVAANLPEAVDLILKSEQKQTACLTAQSSERACAWDIESASYATRHLRESIEILKTIDAKAIEQIAELLAKVREQGGRLFFIGVGGGAGHASHAVCDFRKIAQFEAYAPSDNVSELTARVNDEGWDTAYANWLRGSRLCGNDSVFVFSVGGGDAARNVSSNLVRALEFAQTVGAKICGVVGRDGGYTARVADACVVVPVVNPATITPHTESFQALLWHLLVSHPRLKASETKWESMQPSSDSHDAARSSVRH
ncbi:MAG TPA: HAD-IIIA family hydrolase [Candidatus Acidoferrales bacterium]|nr:HAD-IIIA family hydrolase [Candidatus Acidoferrales bacterium]